MDLFPLTSLEQSPASKFIKEKYHKYVAPGQHTVHRTREYHDNYIDFEVSDDILNSRGKRLLKRVRERIATEKPKAVVIGYLGRSRTGMMIVDVKGNGPVTMLCTWNDLHLTGRVSDAVSEAVGESIHTSPVILYDAAEGWVYTKSGSIYKFKGQKNE